MLLFCIGEVTAATGNSTGATAVTPKVTYTPSEINTAATKVKTFVETNHRLPNYVTIKNRQVTMPQFLLLLSYDITQTSCGSKASITLKNVKAPASPMETVKNGSINRTELVKIAQTVKSSINSQGKAPNYMSSSLGKIRYESLIYLFSKTMDYYVKNKKLPNSIKITLWSSDQNGTSDPEPSAIGASFTITQICQTATNLRNYVDLNCKLPCTVTINNKTLSTPQFLQLLSSAINQLYTNSTASVILKNTNSPTSPSENMTGGILEKTEYVKLAQDVKVYINSNSKAPDNMSSALGTIRFETLVYIFSKTMSFYDTNSRLPNTLSVFPWITDVPEDVAIILNTIGKQEAEYEDIQGVSDLQSFLRLGYGDCWADSLYLYTRLNSAGILVRIMGYVEGGSGVGYRHAWVQINLGSGWNNWNYALYNSQHFGDVGCGIPYVLIGPGVSNPSIIDTGY